MELQLDPDQIKQLAGQIDQTVSQLGDVEAIIHDTRGDLARVNNLKDVAANSR